jgi:hypothetical protein
MNIESILSLIRGMSVPCPFYTYLIQEFQRIASKLDLEVTTIPLASHDPYYCCDDIEIWEVKRKSSNSSLLYPVTDPTGGISLQNWGEKLSTIPIHVSIPPSVNTLLSIRQGVIGREEAEQDDRKEEGIIGSYIWASSVVVSRLF